MTKEDKKISEFSAQMRENDKEDLSTLEKLIAKGAVKKFHAEDGAMYAIQQGKSFIPVAVNLHGAMKDRIKIIRSGDVVELDGNSQVRTAIGEFFVSSNALVGRIASGDQRPELVKLSRITLNVSAIRRVAD